MTLLATVVGASGKVAATSARSAKTRLLAECLRAMNVDELEIGVLYLSGEIRQGRIGIGPSALRNSVAAPSITPTLEMIEVDRLVEELKTIRGAGSSARRATALRTLFKRATLEEQEFLLRL